ncbi:kinase binding protein CGI-121-domain-containing protein [Piptocephalis cylindrospora]|uniref:EKC/KEOPS complex subunit CGI121 n=1 Tax=Piptocephalis cylindrospora TaxID=1907219 RepID=A0A4P9Y8K3_9FUNG|nr:kinase binding protein CGI-121-domain-containing protein [Piptocephalis cylindrospora]|eukprot:RKP15497.1 kinase binding protein CGI-121-domain-containing protein [Piptocephalis cylindrospora]
MSVYTQTLDMWPQRGAVQALLLGPSQSMDGKVPSTTAEEFSLLLFLDARMLTSIFPVLLAVNKAITAEEDGRLRTNNLATEILFNLSPTTNINESLAKYGVKTDPHPILALHIGPPMDDNEGSLRASPLLSVEKDLGKDVDVAALCKYFKLDPSKDAHDIQDLERMIIATMALKGVSAK